VVIVSTIGLAPRHRPTRDGTHCTCGQTWKTLTQPPTETLNRHVRYAHYLEIEAGRQTWLTVVALGSGDTHRILHFTEVCLWMQWRDRTQLAFYRDTDSSTMFKP
jgi:hypothetical protein